MRPRLTMESKVQLLALLLFMSTVQACGETADPTPPAGAPVFIEPFLTLEEWEGSGAPDERPYFYKPNSVAIDDDGEIYVLDAGNQRVVVFDFDGNVVRQFGRRGDGPGEFTLGLDWGDSIQLAENGVIVLEQDMNRVQVLDRSGEPITGFSYSRVATSMYSDGRLIYLCVTPINAGAPTVAVYTSAGVMEREFGSGFLDRTSPRIHALNRNLIAVSRDGVVKQAFNSWPMIRTFAPESDSYQDRWYDFSWWGDPGLSSYFTYGHGEAVLHGLQAGETSSLPARVRVFWDIEFVEGPSVWMTLSHKGGSNRLSIVQVFADNGDPLQSYRLLPETEDEEGNVPWPIDIGVSPSGRIMCAVDFSLSVVRCYQVPATR